METKSWNDLNLSEGVIKSIQELQFESLTPVQAACIPIFMKKKDVAVEAVTGSGKTLAFLVPMFEMLLKYAPFKKLDVGAIIISPTRELAAQTAEIVDLFLKHMPQFSSALLIGGSPVFDDITHIMEKGANIITATPGRLADLFDHNQNLKLASCVKSLEMLILDEADKLLDMGFEKAINTILSHLPKQRLTGLFSATQTKEMEDLIRAGLRNPVLICVKEKGMLENGNQKTPATLSNFYMICEPEHKLSTLLAFLRSKRDCKCMVFFGTCASVEYFSCLLKLLLKHVPVISIHGKMKKKRHHIFSDFKKHNSGVLLCTDVMARGVDIPDVEWVIQFDPPSSASSFVHRCGRTARIGKTGNALVILLPTEEPFVTFLSVNQKVDLVQMEPPACIDITPKVKKISSKNREIFEKGTRAFVSFARFYTKHECNLLFRLKDIDLGKLANGYALLKMPKMPELKNKIINSFKPVDIDFESIPYLDKHREKQRKIRLQEVKENPKLLKKTSTQKEQWLRQKRLKQKKIQAKQRKQKNIFNEKDYEELARDYRLLKKFKKRKITEEEFDAEFMPDTNEGSLQQ